MRVTFWSSFPPQVVDQTPLGYEVGPAADEDEAAHHEALLLQVQKKLDDARALIATYAGE